MMELFQIGTLVLLALIWLSIGKASAAMAQQTAILNAHLEKLDDRLDDFEERLKDNDFKTDDERELDALMQP